MALRRKTQQPTFTERFNAANAKTAAALSVFEAAARDLDAAADEKAQLNAEVQAELDALSSLQEELSLSEDDDRAAAEKLRSFLA